MAIPIRLHLQVYPGSLASLYLDAPRTRPCLLLRCLKQLHACRVYIVAGLRRGHFILRCLAGIIPSDGPWMYLCVSISFVPRKQSPPYSYITVTERVYCLRHVRSQPRVAN